MDVRLVRRDIHAIIGNVLDEGCVWGDVCFLYCDGKGGVYSTMIAMDGVEVCEACMSWLE